jgi:outer membrane protein
VLLQRDAVVLANPAMDITSSVITGLNAKITQFAFDRERLDQAAPAPAAGAPAPAQPARRP